MDMIMNISKNIAGEITLSKTPGRTMKKWRELFEITQSELASYLGVSPSTISDYESNRRLSPGTHVVSRFVNALIALDQSKGGRILSRLTQGKLDTEKYFTIHEFATGLSGIDFIKLVKGKAVINEELLQDRKVYGYTLINSLKVILDMPPSQFLLLYGSMNERAFIFTEVATGRSPLVAIRVASLKPSIVVLHGLRNVDDIALKIAEKEQLPVITTDMSVNKIREALNKL